MSAQIFWQGGQDFRWSFQVRIFGSQVQTDSGTGSFLSVEYEVGEQSLGVSWLETQGNKT